MQSIYESMSKKAKADKAYHLSVWNSHIMELSRLTSTKEGGLSWSRYLEMKTELLAAAELSWSGA